MNVCLGLPTWAMCQQQQSKRKMAPPCRAIGCQSSSALASRAPLPSVLTDPRQISLHSGSPAGPGLIALPPIHSGMLTDPLVGPEQESSAAVTSCHVWETAFLGQSSPSPGLNLLLQDGPGDLGGEGHLYECPTQRQYSQYFGQVLMSALSGAP